MNLPPFYLNVILLNKDAVVKEQVKEKAGSGIFGRTMGKVASSMVSDSSVIQKVAEELLPKIRNATENLGISCSIQSRFQKGPFITFKVQLLEIEKMQLILAAKGPEYASDFTSLLASLTALGLADTALPKIDEKIDRIVHTNIMLKFAEKIPVQLKEKNIECKIDVVPTEEQAEYFFNALEELGLA
jgi:hypothetical protein